MEQYEKDQVVQVENDAAHVGRLQNGHGPWDESMKEVTFFSFIECY